MSKTNYLENKVLDHSLGVTSYTMPTVYLAAFTAAPGEAGGGTEVTGGSYARVALASKLGAASSGATVNSADINFPTASADWGTVTHFAVFDASSAGNMLHYGALIASKIIYSGDVLSFLAGQLTFTED